MCHNRIRYTSNVVIFLIALMFVFSGCEGSFWSASAPNGEDELAKKFQPETNNACIYVYRPTTFDLPTGIFLYNDGNFIACPNNGSFVRLVVTPGSHVIGTKCPSARSFQDTLEVIAEAGKLYYFEVRYQAAGITGDSPKLRQVEEGAAQNEIRRYKLICIGTLTSFPK